MAIQITRKFKNIDVPQCYVRVAQVNCSKNQGTVFVEFKADKDSESFEATSTGFDVTLNGNNFIAQAYAHLKTLPEFAGAVDC